MSFSKVYKTVEKIKDEGIKVLEVQKEGCLPVAYKLDRNEPLVTIVDDIINFGNELGGTLILAERRISKDVIRIAIIKKPVTA